ncbi:MAG: hypothetical protein HY926_13050 [Elusimicrobia bacterium]|nr:hypothetical protein [Elusimicrobiota bacterium]
MKSFYPTKEPLDDYPCEIKLDGAEILVTYADEDFHPNGAFWRGTETTPGHYQLRLDGGDGQASLHRFPDSTILEGYWREDGEDGMWRIELR